MSHPYAVRSLNDGMHTFLLTAGKQLLVGHGSWPVDSEEASELSRLKGELSG